MRRSSPGLRWISAAALAMLAATATAAAQVIKDTDDPLEAAPATTAPPAAEEAPGDAGAATAGAPSSAGGAAATASGPLVLAVEVHEDEDAEAATGPVRAGLGDRITVEIRGLSAALAALPTGCAGIILFLDGVPIPGSPPESCTLDGADGTARFLLDRTEDSDDAWHVLLGSPGALARRIKVSAGPEGNVAWPTRVHDFELAVLPKGWSAAYIVFLLLLVAVFVRLARRTALLRDPHSVAPAGAQAPYSLSRCQLGFWMLLTIAAYVFIWMITEELDTISGSVLALLGIGSGTALGASVIAQGKAQPGGKAAATAPAAAPTAPTAPTAPNTESAAAPVETPPAATAARTSGPAMTRVAASQGLLTDLVNGSQGMSLYRAQMVAWTLVLGVIFCVQVYYRLAMPEFSASLLGLMGISSATYLGAKFPEE